MKSKTILRISIDSTNTRGPIAFEQVLASLHGLLSEKAKSNQDESVSFEIANVNGRIYFYFACAPHLKSLISSQIYSQYPQAYVEEVSEYFTKQLIQGKEVLISGIRPDKVSVFPFKRYPQFEDRINQQIEDPLGPIVSSISHLYHRTDSAVIQIVINPISPQWNQIAEATLRRFFGKGPWQWDWFRTFYAKMRLDYSTWKRVFKFPIWGLVLFFLGWTKGGNSIQSNISNGENSENNSQLDRESQTSGRHDRETVFSASFDKISRLNFAVNIRAAYFHSDPDKLHAKAKIREIIGTFQQFSIPQMNHFVATTITDSSKSHLFKKFIHRKNDRPFALSQEELATIAHLPTETVKSAGIQWVNSKTLEPPAGLPSDNETDTTVIGKLNFRHHRDAYGIRVNDRRRHVYIIGKTGMGKSTLLENMIFSDIEKGRGVGIIDPHGDLAEAVLAFAPKHRINDIIYIDPSDRDWPVAFNMLEGKNKEQRELIASGMIGVVKKLNIDSWGPRLEHFLRNTLLALVEAPDTTMLGVTRMLVDKPYREKILKHVTNLEVQSFWENEFKALSPQRIAEAIGPIQNKVGQFLSTPFIRNILGQTKSKLDVRYAMDNGKIIIVNLSKGKIGEDNSALLGSMLITKFQIDAMSRADIPESERRDFYLYVDEFQNFATDSFATILSEARKYKLNLTMANQFIAQMSEEVSAAVFGNVGSIASFQVGVDDAKVLSEQFDELKVGINDLTNLPKYNIYNKILVEGMPTVTFSGSTMHPPKHSDLAQKEKIIQLSRQKYATSIDKVEERLRRWGRTEDEKKDIQQSKKPSEKKSENQKSQNQQQQNTNTPHPSNTKKAPH